MFILESLIFLALVFFLLFLPGWFLLGIIFPGKEKFSNLEKTVISFGVSLIMLDFVFFVFSYFSVSITRLSASSAILALLLGLGVAFFLRRPKTKTKNKKGLNFSKNEKRLIFILLFSIFLIKTLYLAGTISPTSTDMGHHMYWAKEMSETGELPRYEGMPDFIIGEHIIFGLFNIVGNLSFFGAFPISLLYLFNILSILAVFILVLRIFKNSKVAIMSLLFLGVVYAISSPQAKFVSGGVIGNVFGNFLLPLVFYLYFLAFEKIADVKFDAKKDLGAKKMLALAVFLTFGLFYTHHLTSFIFLFSILGIILFLIILNFKNVKTIFGNIFKLAFSKEVISVFILGLIFFFFIFTPNYASVSAVDTAVGSPVKETRTGLTWANIFSMTGELRVILGILGGIFLVFNYRKKNIGTAILLGWTFMLFLMSLAPGWLFVDIPSSRVGNYLTYPLALLTAVTIFEIFFKDYKSKKNIFGENVIKISLIFVLSSILTVGVYESLVSLKDQKEDSQLRQVFSASESLEGKIGADEWLLKDHNYLTGDAWIKLFFMREYKFPLSRSYFKRYEDPTNPREMCTLYMISNPLSREAEVCFNDTKTRFIIVNPLYDENQFRVSDDFNKIYSASEVAVFYKK